MNANIKRRDQLGSAQKSKLAIKSLIPWCIVGFLALAAVNSLGAIPPEVSGALKDASKFLMVAALAAIGMNTDLSKMRKAGLKPMLHGFIISALVVLVAIGVEYMIGVV